MLLLGHYETDKQTPIHTHTHTHVDFIYTSWKYYAFADPCVRNQVCLDDGQKQRDMESEII